MKQKSSFPWMWLTLGLAAAAAAWVFAPAWAPGMALQSPDSAPFYYAGWKAQQFNGLINHQMLGLSHDLLLSLILPLHFYHDISYVVSAALLALAVALYLKGLRLHPLACLAGGLAMAFSGYHFTLFSAGHRGYFVMMPYAVFLFALIDRAVERPRWSQFALMALCVAYALGAQPDILVLMVGLAALYALMRVIQALRHNGAQERRELLRGWGIGLGAAIMTLSIAAASVLQRTVTITLAARDQQVRQAAGLPQGNADADDPAVQEQTRKNAWVFATNWSLPPEDMLEFIAPNVRGFDSYNPSGPYWGRLGQTLDWQETRQGFVNYRQHTVYLGVFQLLLALYAVLGCLRRNRSADVAAAETAAVETDAVEAEAPPFASGNRGSAAFWTAVLAVSILLAMGRYTPLYRLFYAIPGMDRLRAPVKFLHLAELALSVLFAMGLSDLLRNLHARQRAARPAALACAVVAVLGALGCLLAVLLAPAEGGPMAERLAAMNFAAMEAPLRSQFAGALLRATGLFALAAAVFGAAAFLAQAAWAKAAGGIAAAIVAGVVVDLGTTARPYVHVMDLSPLMARNPIADALLTSGPPDGVGIANRLSPLPTVHPLLWAFLREGFLLSEPPSNADGNWYSAQTLPHFRSDIRKQWQFWGTRAVLVPTEAVPRLAGEKDFALLGTFAMPGGVLRAVPADQAQFAAMAYKRWTPTAAVFTQWRNADPDSVWKILANPDVDLMREAVVENGPVAGPAVSPSPAKGMKLVLPASQANYREAVVEVASDTPGLLVLRERFGEAPRVVATVNGKRQPALRTNGFFWSVPVEAGESRVVFEPVLAWWRLGLHGAGILIALAAICNECRRRAAVL